MDYLRKNEAEKLARKKRIMVSYIIGGMLFIMIFMLHTMDRRIAVLKAEKRTKRLINREWVRELEKRGVLVTMQNGRIKYWICKERSK